MKNHTFTVIIILCGLITGCVHTIGRSRNDEADEREPVVDPLPNSPKDHP